MSKSSNSGEPSMEEILASIRALVSQDTAQQPAPPVTPAPRSAQKDDDHRAAKSGAPSQNDPFPAPATGSSAPLSAAPHGASTERNRSDEDDLADLLDEPLSSGDPLVPTAAPGWSLGTASADDRPANSPAPSAAPMSFDFGAMVPSRDPAPSRDAKDARMPSLSQSLTSSAKPMSSPTATAASDSLAPSQSARGGPATEVSPHAAAGGFLAPAQSPASSPSGLAVGNSPASGVQHASRSKDLNSTSAVASSGSEAASAKAVTPAVGGHASRPAPGFSSGASTFSQNFAKDAAAGPGFGSIEPVLKGFGQIDTKSGPFGSEKAIEKTQATAARAEIGGSPAPASEDLLKSAGIPANSGRNGVEGRTLEDAVMELLRPMLREWLDENLPRVIDDIVRREVAGAVATNVERTSKP